MGLIAPGWYLAPQRREVAEAAWTLVATLLGALGDGPIFGLDAMNVSAARVAQGA